MILLCITYALTESGNMAAASAANSCETKMAAFNGQRCREAKTLNVDRKTNKNAFKNVYITEK